MRSPGNSLAREKLAETRFAHLQHKKTGFPIGERRRAISADTAQLCHQKNPWSQVPTEVRDSRRRASQIELRRALQVSLITDDERVIHWVNAAL
jgi:hypothetical protein